MNDDRWEELLRQASAHRSSDVEVEVVDAARAVELFPLLNPEGLAGALHYPQDGRGNATDTTMALAKGARDGGAQIFEQTLVTDVNVRGDRVVGVSTDAGDIEAEYVVNCTGMWGREFGSKAGVALPLQALAHYYVVTEDIPDLPVGHADHQELGRLVVRQGRRRQADGRLLRGRAARRGCRAASPRTPSSRRSRRTGTTSGRSTSRWSSASRCSPTRASASSSAGRRASRRTACTTSARFPSSPTTTPRAGSTPSASSAVRAPARCWLTGSSTAGRRWTCPRRDSATRGPVPGQPALPRGARGRDARPRVRDALAVPAARDDARHPTLTAARGDGGRGRGVRRSGRVGARQLVRAGRRRPALRPLLRQGRSGSSTGPRSTERCASRSGCSTSARSARSRCRAATPARCCSVCRRTTSTSSPDAPSTPSGSTSAAASRPT